MDPQFDRRPIKIVTLPLGQRFRKESWVQVRRYFIITRVWMGYRWTCSHGGFVKRRPVDQDTFGLEFVCRCDWGIKKNIKKTFSFHHFILAIISFSSNCYFRWILIWNCILGMGFPSNAPFLLLLKCTKGATLFFFRGGCRRGIFYYGMYESCYHNRWHGGVTIFKVIVSNQIKSTQFKRWNQPFLNLTCRNASILRRQLNDKVPRIL